MNEDTIKQLEGAKYGGLTNVMHRVNIAGETHISKFRYKSKDKKVISQLTEYVVTHILGIDFNSLYPSVMASIQNLLIRYTGGILYMPGRFKERILDPVRMKEIVEDEQELFFVSVKAHFPEELYDELINFAPIIRPYFTVEYIDNAASTQSGAMKSSTKGERKLTQLLSTMGEFQTFYSYYLWMLIDLGLVIDEYKEMNTFYKMDTYNFNEFVTTIMSK
jgi:hypothetical protein